MQWTENLLTNLVQVGEEGIHGFGNWEVLSLCFWSSGNYTS